MKKLVWIALVFCLISAPAIAGKGGVQVSTVTVDCGDEAKESNILESAGPARIWLNVPAGTNTDGLTFEITDQGKPVANPTTFVVTACGDGWFYGDITLPAGKGSVTLSVEDRDGANVGSDTFQLE